MISWLRLLFYKAEEEAKKVEEEAKLKIQEEQVKLRKLTKGDLKKLYAQGKIEAKDLKP